jgi:stress-induced morphogen
MEYEAARAGLMTIGLLSEYCVDQNAMPVREYQFTARTAEELKSLFVRFESDARLIKRQPWPQEKTNNYFEPTTASSKRMAIDLLIGGPAKELKSSGGTSVPHRELAASENRDPISEPGLLHSSAPPGRQVKVSVIIPCYNYAHFLPEAVESVIQQTFQDFEIVIVNDGSTDHSSEVAEQLKTKYSSCQIRIINQENSGQPAISRNRGIAQALGKYILPLDADDKIGCTYLEKAVQVLDREPEIGVVYSWLRHFGSQDDIWPTGRDTSPPVSGACAPP